MRLAALGAAVSVKVLEGLMVSAVVEVAVPPFTVTAIGPVAAPAGTTNINVVAVVDETSAEMNPPAAVASVTLADVPEPGWRLVPFTAMIPPIVLDGGLKLIMVGGAKLETVRLAEPESEPPDAAAVMVAFPGA